MEDGRPRPSGQAETKKPRPKGEAVWPMWRGRPRPRGNGRIYLAATGSTITYFPD
jgi:hypothetical protein